MTDTRSRMSRLLALAVAGASLTGCFCMRARFADDERAAPTLPAEMSRLGPSCERWFVRECETDGVKAVWFFHPRIEGPAEAAAYDVVSGELLYQRQYGSTNGWAFTPLREYGSAPKCRPSLDTAGAEAACAWIERRASGAAEAAAPPVASPAP
jgi:hypothetical protein